MTPFEYLLAPLGITVTILLLQAAFYRSSELSATLTMLGLAVSYYLSTHYFEQLIFISTLVILLFSWAKEGASEEFKILILLSVMGALTCVNAQDFLTFFVGIELLTLPIYGLIGLNAYDSKNIQAAIKYLVLAGTSSAFMLLGIAFLYAQSGSMALQLGSTKGAFLLFVGIGFKLSLVPFHLWTGDVYEDSPLPVTAFLATVSKIALVSVLVRLTPTDSLTQILSLVAALSMLIGSLLTLKQQNMSRFLGYSSITHMGYILVAWLVGANLGFYMGAYTLTLLIIFWMLSIQHRFANGFLVLGLLSLMGLPVLPIFWGKYQILVTAFQGQHLVLFGILIFSSLLGVYGYARLIARIYQRSVEA